MKSSKKIIHRLTFFALLGTFCHPVAVSAAPPDAPVISSVFGRVTGVDISFSPTSGLTYQARVLSAGNPVATSASGGTTSPISIEGLSANTDYTVELIASNNTNESATARASFKTYQSIRLDFQFTSVVLDGSNLTVSFAVNPDYKYALIWDGAVQRSELRSSPQVISSWPAGKTIQLGIADRYGNYGYSNPTVPVVNTPTVSNQAPISITPITNLTVGGTATLSISGGSGTGAVSYTTSTSSICTISGSTLSAVAPGSCSINATKAADSSYNSASTSTVITIGSVVDSSPPVINISALTVNPSSLFENGTFALSVPITDATGVASVTVTLARSSSPTNYSVGDTGLTSGVFNLALTSGTALNGTWGVTSQSINFGGGSSTGYLVSGVYDLSVTASDTKGLSVSTTKSSVLIVGRQASGPTLVNSTLSTPSVVRGSSFTISTRAVSYINTVSQVTAVISALGVSAILTRGEASSHYADYSGSLLIPNSASPGSYSISIVANTSNGRTSGSIPVGTIQVTAPAPNVVITSPLIASTVSNSLILTAQASIASGSPGRIAYVCGSLDGAKLNSGVTISGSGTWWGASQASYGPGSACFVTSSLIGSVGEFKWSIDVSAWSEAEHVFQVYVIDSTNAESAKISRSFNVVRIAPTVSFTTPTANSTQSGVFTVKATGSVASGSTAIIDRVCFKIDGIYSTNRVIASANGSWFNGGSGNISGFGACTYTSGIRGSGEFAWSIDATSLSNGAHTLEVLILDTTNKQSSWASLPFTVSIAQPTVSFTTPTANSTQSGVFTVKATGSVASGSTAIIDRVCFKIDGIYSTNRVIASANGSWFNGGSGNISGFGACTYTSGIRGSGEFAWSIDATSLSNGAHTLEVLILDTTNKQSSWASLPFTVSIAQPTVSFTTPTANSTQSGVFTVKATGSVASGSTAIIDRVCFKIDGIYSTNRVIASANGSWFNGGSGNISGFGACTYTSGIRGSGEFAWSIDATSLSNGAHTLEVLILDTTNKQSSWASLPFTVSIAQPTVSFTTPTANSTQSGVFTVKATGSVASGSTAIIDRVCFKIDGIYSTNRVIASANGSWFNGGSGNISGFGACTYTSGIRGSGEFAWSIDATSLSNGAHTLEVLILDTTNKQSSWASLPFTVNNPPPTLAILSPGSGAQVAGKVNVEISMSSPMGDVLVGISGGSADPVNYASGASSSARGIPSETQLWNAGNSKNFKWVIDTSKWNPGLKTIYVTVIDKASQVVTQPLVLDIQSTKPTVSIISPSPNQVVKGKVTFRAIFTASAIAQKTIRYIGISESNAKSLFNAGSAYSSLPSRYTDYSIQSGLSTFEGSWTIDYSSYAIGPQEVWFAVEDSEGAIGEAKVAFTIEKAKPVVQIISPSQNQTISGAISLRVSATGDPATSGKITRIALSNQKFIPQFAGSLTSCRVDSSYKCWSVQDSSSFEWTSEPGSFRDGPLSLTVIVFDDSDNQSTASVSVSISSIAPNVVITAPTETLISRSQFTIVARATPNAGSGAEIIGVAITNKFAVPQFPGTPASAGTSGLPNSALIWKVSNIKELAWRIDANNLTEGDNLINVFALDSNGKLGQTSIVIHVAPEAQWELKTQGAAVLGQSVAIVVTMKTNVRPKSSIPIVATLQTGPTPGGPWTDTGNLTFDSSGQATGRVLVTDKLYVRVNHPQLDAIQIGTSEPLRIVNVPDPKRQGASSGNGAKNPDGSLPQVVCTAINQSKAGKKIAITCSAQDVQDVSQPVQISAQTTGSPKNVGIGKIQGSRITGSFTPKALGTYTIFLKGSGNGFVPWTSNPLKVKVVK